MLVGYRGSRPVLYRDSLPRRQLHQLLLVQAQPQKHAPEVPLRLPLVVDDLVPHGDLELELGVRHPLRCGHHSVKNGWMSA